MKSGMEGGCDHALLTSPMLTHYVADMTHCSVPPLSKGFIYIGTL